MTAPPDDGYRPTPAGGPPVRTDIVEAFVFRRPAPGADAVEILQLLRAGDPMRATWQPVMGHVERGEGTVRTVVRELREEVGLEARDGAPGFLGLWAFERVRPYFLAELDCVVMSPRFGAEVAAGWEPTLNEEHTDARWVGAPFHAGQAPAEAMFMWPGQREAIGELLSSIVPASSPARDALRVRLPGA